MPAAPKSPNEAERLDALHRLDILDTPREAIFDRLTSLAARYFDVPVAIVSLIDEDRQWLKSTFGLDVSETPRDVAFCAYAILGDSVLVVPDATADARFSDNPLVVGDPNIRFYAGAPLRLANGIKLGTLCILDFKPRSNFGEADRAALDEFAQMARDLILHRNANAEPTSELQPGDDGRSALTETRKLLQLFIDYVPASVAMFDTDMRYITASRHWITDYRLKPESLRGKSHYEIFPDIPQHWKDLHSRAIAGEVLQCEEDSFERADGNTDWLRWILHPWRFADGTVGGIVMFTELLNEKKAAEEEKTRLDRFVRGILHSIEDGIVACWPDGKLAYVNRAAETFLGLSESSLPLKDWRHHYSIHQEGSEDDLAELWAPLTQALLDEATPEVEISIARKGAPARDYLSNAQPIRTESGEALGAVAVLRDITDSKAADKKLKHAQKMEAVGQLSGGIAHDFNNLLTVIIGNLQLLERKLPADPDLRRRSQAALQGAQRGSELVKRLLAFSRHQELAPRHCDPAVLLKELCDLPRRTLGADIEIGFDTAVGTWAISVDRNELENALLNLVINARDAMPGGGHIKLSTRNVTIDDPVTAPAPDMRPGDYVCLSVRDNGSGMDPAIQARIFEPFFTTKDSGLGSGLGLSMVYGFVRQSGGAVSVDSTTGIGTAISLYFPRSHADPEAKPVERKRANLRAKPGETILVVEDDDAVRDISVTMLQDLGYTVLTAENGPQALAVARERSDIDLLFTDMLMPGGMNGRELSQALRIEYPDLKSVYCSGYTERALGRDGILDKDIDLIAKPFDQNELALRLRDALDREPSPASGKN